MSTDAKKLMAAILSAFVAWAGWVTMRIERIATDVAVLMDRDARGPVATEARR